jgi:hypothetical protein
VYITKGRFEGIKLLDARQVDQITAFLFHAGGHDDPAQLAANAGKSFQGSIVLGMGFTFDDTDKKGVASSIADMRRLIAENPDNQSAIFPYIGGEEVNSSPTHAHHRYVINFGDREEAECRKLWPKLLDIVEERVKPERLRLPPKNAWNRDVAARWWQFGADRKGLRLATAGMERVLACCGGTGASKYPTFVLLPGGMVYSQSLCVFGSDALREFGLLQSAVHDSWLRFQGATLEDRLRYNSSVCFETFPFPAAFESNEALEQAGREYYDFRAALMVKNDEGLTKTYNRFHDRDNREPDIVRLRELHAAMDRAVLDAYGWHDIKTDCDFFADYTEEDEDGNEIEKSIRYRWPDEVRDEVLARLLALNAERHAEEVKLGLVSPDGKRLKQADDDQDADDAENDDDDAPAPKRVKSGCTKSAAATPKSAARKSAKGKQPKTPKARGKATSRSGRLLFGGDD